MRWLASGWIGLRTSMAREALVDLDDALKHGGRAQVRLDRLDPTLRLRPQGPSSTMRGEAMPAPAGDPLRGHTVDTDGHRMDT